MSSTSGSSDIIRPPKKIITLCRAPRPSARVPFNISGRSLPLIIQPQNSRWNTMPQSSSTSTSTIIFLPSSYCSTLPSTNSKIVFTTAQNSNSQMPLECSAQFYQSYSHSLPEQLSDNQQLEILKAEQSVTLDSSQVLQVDLLSVQPGDVIYTQQGEQTQQSESIMYTQDGEVLYAQQGGGDAFSTQQSEVTSQVLLQPHPINEIKIEQGSLQPTCYICNRVFGQKKNMYRHMRIIHQADQVLNKKQITICPLCKETFGTVNKLNAHFLSDHEITIEREFLEFNSLQEFKDWKERFERETKSFHRTYHSKKNGQQIIYVCNRMGMYVPKRKGVEKCREPRANGSKRIGGTCPARIVMEQTAGKVLVTVTKSHVGHELELKALDLTFSERQYLAAKMAQGYSKQTLLDKINETISPNLRMSYITIKDLHNIAKNSSAKMRSTFEADNAQSVDLFIQQLRDKSNNNNCNEDYSEVDAASNVDELPSGRNGVLTSVDAYEPVTMDAANVEYEPTAYDAIDIRKQTIVERFTSLVNKCRSNDELDVIAKHLARIGPGLRALKQSTSSLDDEATMDRNTNYKLLPHQRRLLKSIKVKRGTKAAHTDQQMDSN